MKSAARFALLAAICGQALSAQGLLVNPGFEQHRTNPVGWRIPSSAYRVISTPRLVAKDRLGARSDQAFEFSCATQQNQGAGARVLEQSVHIKARGWYSFGGAWRLVGSANQAKHVAITVSVGSTRFLYLLRNQAMGDHRHLAYLNAGTATLGFDFFAGGSRHTALTYKIRVDDFSLEAVGVSSAPSPRLSLAQGLQGAYRLTILPFATRPTSLVFLSFGKLARGVRIPNLNGELWLDPLTPPGIMLLGSNARVPAFTVPIPRAVSGVRVYVQTLAIGGVSWPTFGNWNAIYLRGQ